MKAVILTISIIIISASIGAQGLSSHYTDNNGSYLRIGPEPSQFFRHTYLNFGNNSIFTSGGPISAFRRPTLKLNPVNGSVTIGNTESDFAALTIKSFSEVNNTLDLRLEGDGRIGIQRSLYFDLDDDNNEDSYFLIRDSDKNNLFTVGETGQSYLKGDLTIDGDINLNGVIKGSEELEIIQGINFQGDYNIDRLGNVSSISFDESQVKVSANLNLPHGARITKVKIIYKDNSESDLKVTIQSHLDVSSFYDNHFAWDSSNSSSTYRSVLIDNLNIVIGSINRIYNVILISEDWGWDTVALTAIKIYYTR